MSNQIFPTLKGLLPNITKTPIHNTLRKESQNGTSVRTRLRAYPKYRYKLSFAYLMDNGQQDDDLHKLMGFYNSMGGSFDNFLLLDKDDCKVNNQLFARGDGVNTIFRLARNYGGFVEPIYGVDVSSAKVYINDILSTNAIVNVDGTVRFQSPPILNDRLSWSGTFYHRVIFDDDSNDFDRIFSGLWELHTIKLLSDKG